MADEAKNESTKAKKTFTFTLSRTGLVISVTTLVLGVVWVFIFGVLVGRGYQPENSVPELARIMPGAPDVAIEEAKPEAPEPVLKAEELGFSKELKKSGEAAPAVPEEKPATKPVIAKPSEVAKADAQDKAAKEAVAKAEAAPAKAEAEAARTGRYEYVFQTASFRKKAMADELADKLRAKGLITSIESASTKDGDWHRVLVTFQGRPQDTQDLRKTLRSAGLGTPMLKSKKAL